MYVETDSALERGFTWYMHTHACTRMHTHMCACTHTHTSAGPDAVPPNESHAKGITCTVLRVVAVHSHGNSQQCDFLPKYLPLFGQHLQRLTCIHTLRQLDKNDTHIICKHRISHTDICPYVQTHAHTHAHTHMHPLPVRGAQVCVCAMLLLSGMFRCTAQNVHLLCMNL